MPAPSPMQRFAKHVASSQAKQKAQRPQREVMREMSKMKQRPQPKFY